MTIKERIQQYLDNKNINTNEFERSIHASKSYWRNTKNISAEVLAEIVRVYSDLNPEWLLLEKGEPLKKEDEDDLPKISYTSGAPYYNVDFVGGFDMVLNDQTINPEYLIDFKKYNDATYWCNVTGHSMEPEIAHGDIVALKEIEDKSFLPLGEVYAIVTTNNMRTIKRLGPGSQKGCYTLVPTNKDPEYGIQEIPEDKIYKIFSVLGCMKRL